MYSPLDKPPKRALFTGKLMTWNPRQSNEKREIAMFLKGVLISLSLITSVGPQNTFVLRQGITKNHVFSIALLSSLCNSISILAGVLGLGRFLAHHPAIQKTLIWIGIIFLGVFAARAFFLVFRSHKINTSGSLHLSRKKAIIQSVLFSWANPLTVLESFVILGSISSQYSFQNALLFGLGCVVSTFAWFFGISYGAGAFSRHAGNPLTWKIVDFLTGTVCTWAAFNLFKRLMEC